MERNVYLQLEEPAIARQRWLSAMAELNHELAVEKIPLRESLGRVAGEPVASVRSSPAFHGAAMDGIAVTAEKTWAATPDRPLRLKLGQDAFWINTGHPLPPGTNAIVMVEHVNTGDDDSTVIIEQPAFPWQHVRKTGEDMVATEIILVPGTEIGAFELGAMAAAGVHEVPVFKKPRVAIIPSGDEIVPFDQLLAEDAESGKKLPEFNSLVFSAMAGEHGAEPFVLPVAADNPESIKNSILDAVAQKADLIIINAGASAGSHDFTSKVIAASGKLLLHGIAMMPGKPAALGIVETESVKTPIIGAPGYPVSAALILEQFMLPLLAFWQKQAAPDYPEIPVRPVNALPSRPGMEEYIRVKLGKVGGNYYAVPLPRGAGVVSSLSRADAIIKIPANCEGLNADEAIASRLLKPQNDIDGALLAIGSHDNTLDLLDSLLRQAHPGMRLNSAHVGSLGGLKAIKAGHAHLSGSHLLDPATGIYNQQAIRDNLTDIPVTLVRLVDRQQGFITKPGNPANIRGIADLARPEITFINRQAGSGTRVLLDYELGKAGIRPEQINGYGNEEYTHMNVAVAVASGRAGTGLGAAAAAKALGLDFIPLGMEQYDLVIPRQYMDDPRIVALLEVIRSKKFARAAQELGGYDTTHTGEIIWEYTPN